MAEPAKILIVDDDREVHSAVRSALEGQSYRVIDAYDGREGLRKALEETPDLIILDVMMPGKHGFEVCWELKTEPRCRAIAEVPVLMLTVYPDERDRMHTKMRQWVNITPEAYMRKPFDLDTLLKTVEDLLARRSSA